MSTSSPPVRARRRLAWVAAPSVLAVLAAGLYFGCRAPSDPEQSDSGATHSASQESDRADRVLHGASHEELKAVSDAVPDEAPHEVAVRVVHETRPVANARVQLVPLDAAHGAQPPACPCASNDADAGDDDDGSGDGTSALDPECASCPDGVEALFDAARRGVGFLASDELRTDANGVARFPLKSGATPAVWIVAEGLRPASMLAEAQAPGEDPQEVELEGASTLRLRVEDADGNPVQTAELAAFSQLPFWPLTPILRGPEQTLANLPTGAPVQVVVRAPGYVSAALDVPDDAEPMVVVLERPRTLRGRVLHGDGPVAGATIQLDGESRELRTTATSDREGRFSFPNLAPGSYRLTGDKGPLHGEQELTLDEGDAQPELALTLNESAVLRGTVVDAATHKPLSDAVVELRGDDDNFASQTTDEAGHFEITAAPGNYGLHVSEEAHLPLVQALTLAEGQQSRVELSLQGGLTLAGRVVDARGQPVADVRVDVEAPESDGSHGASTDADGHFSVSGLREGTCLVSVAAENHPHVEQPIPVPSGPVTIKLSDGATLDGVVLGPDGPVRHAQVEIATEEPRQLNSGYTDAQGHFHFSALPLGPATAVAVAEGLAASEPMALTLRDGDAATAELHLGAGMTVEGEVVDDQGKPLADAMVEGYLESGPRAPLPGRNVSTSSDAEGHFILSGLRDGEYHLFAYHDGLAQGPQVSTRAGSSDVVLRLMRAGKVMGRVASRSGAPVKHFMVEGQEFHSSDGSFTIRDVSPDSAEIIVEGPFPAVVVPVKVTPGQPLDVGTVLVDDGEPLAGHVLAPDGTPAPGVEVTALPPGYDADAPISAEPDTNVAALDTPRTATTDALGRFSFDHLRSGTYLVQASGAAGSSTAARARTGAGELELVLQPGAALHGRATLSDGSAVSEGAAIFVGGAVTAQSRIVAGVFEFRGLPSGTGQLLVTSPLSNGSAMAQEVSLRPGESRDVTVTLLSGGAPQR